MTKHSQESWALNPADVCMLLNGGGLSRSNNRTSRAVGLSSRVIELHHIPTGVSVTGEIPKGNYSRKQMQLLTQQLYSQLFISLSSKVARHLRIPGR